ncbi:MAG TPA: hypothetical protein PLK37_14075, partial [Terricaulis sp.]|nr:hypothetical protein [Terricaulis sp.]
AAIGVLFVLPWLDTSRVRSMRYRPIARQFFLIFVVVCVVLGWCGGQNPGNILAKSGAFQATLSWVQGGQAAETAIAAPSAGAWNETAAQAEADARANGATMTAVRRLNETQGTLTVVSGGAVESRVVTGETADEMETAIANAKTELGPAGPFFQVERRSPAAFTVTNLSQVATAYYFLFFLLILPILGLRETPGRVPDTIAKPVTNQGDA